MGKTKSIGERLKAMDTRANYLEAKSRNFAEQAHKLRAEIQRLIVEVKQATEAMGR